MIASTALALLMRDGSAGMSLRQIAAALDTGPASLYAYVRDVQELQALVLDLALASVTTTGAGEQPWRERLTALLDSYYTVLGAHTALAQLALSTTAAGPNALRILEAMLALLDEAGVEPSRAAWAVDLLSLYISALAYEHSQRREQADPLGTIVQAIGAVSPDSFPRIHAVRDQLLAGGGRFPWAVEVLLTGFLNTPLAVPATRARPKGRAPGAKPGSRTRLGS